MLTATWRALVLAPLFVGALAACAPQPANESNNLPPVVPGVATLVSIQVAPAAAGIAVGATQQYTATGVYTDFTTQNLTSVAAWTSSAAGTATISTIGPATIGLATGVLAGGPVTVTATYGGKSGTAALTVLSNFSVGGTVSGLPGGGSVVLQDNGGDDLNLTANGTFAFATALTSGTPYTVSVLSSLPSAQVCTVNGASGTVHSADVTSVLVFCSAPAGYTIGGTVTGLVGSLVLQNNGGDALTVTAPGPTFTFATKQADQSTYSVSVLTEPGTQLCTLGGRSGTVNGGAVTTVAVNCQTMTCTSSVVAAPLVPPALDPLVPCQWWFKNTGQNAFADSQGLAGQDINYGTPAVDGSGVVVAVVDTGLEILHEDLAPNVVPGGSYNFLTGSTDPTNTDPTQQEGDHGTSVAGLIAARSGNGLGGQGVAARASLVGFNVLQPAAQTSINFADALGQASYSSGVSVFNNSFGSDSTTDQPFDSFFDTVLNNGVNTLRGGKGAVYIKAAGNGFQGYSDGSSGVSAICPASGLSCQNANMDPDNALPWVIVAGAINASGVRSSYSTAGSALWISAPAGEFGANSNLIGAGYIPAAYQPAMVTTDQSGCINGYSGILAQHDPQQGVISNFDLPGSSTQGSDNGLCNYTSTFNGTSSATPITSGVAALLLEANAALTWRDVKYILARTARQVDGATAGRVTLLGGTYLAEPGWVNNKAATPFHFHNWYGFGRPDVTAALNLAQGFVPNSFGGSVAAGPLVTAPPTGFQPGSPANVAIPDASATGVSSAVTISGSSISFVEAVQVQVNVTHPNVGSLGIELTSPGPAGSGTRSVLLNAQNGFTGSGSLGGFSFGGAPSGTVLLSNAFYGEPANGPWTLKIVDTVPGQAGSLVSWGIRIYGH